MQRGALAIETERAWVRQGATARGLERQSKIDLQECGEMEEGSKDNVPRVNWTKHSKMGCGDNSTTPQIYKKPLTATIYVYCMHLVHLVCGDTRMCHCVLAFSVWGHTNVPLCAFI